MLAAKLQILIVYSRDNTKQAEIPVAPRGLKKFIRLEQKEEYST